MDKVSVIMGVYNSNNKQELKNAIESILSQSYANVELVICDDGSVDDTWVYLCENYSTNNKVKIIRHDINKSLAFALNSCLEYADGEFIARQDADDYSALDRIEKQVKFLKNNEKYAWVSGSFFLFDEEGIYGKRILKKSPIKKDYLYGSPHAHAPMMIRREVLITVGGYDTSLRSTRCEDYDLFMRLFSSGYRGYNLDECLYFVYEGKLAFKRKNWNNYKNVAITQWYGFKSMRQPWWGYIYIVKTIFAAFFAAPIKQLRIHLKRMKGR